MQNQLNNTLQHFGIKGMQWGVRRPVGPDGRVSTGSSDYQKTRKLLTKDTKDMSNSEIQEVVKRLQLEQNYRRVNPTTIDKGKKLAKSALTGVNTAVALYAVSKSPLGQAISKKLKKG